MIPLALLVMTMPVSAPAQPVDDLGRWHAGAYSYSHELGGFAIVGISGEGTESDPVVLTQEFLSASPVTLVIRAERPIRSPLFGSGFANGNIHIRVVAINNSNLPWLEFEFELQEHLGEPSTFGDGLSFDQRKTASSYIASDTYAEYSRDYEPYDRLRFFNGYTDARKTSTFDFLITDFTPRSVFYLVQDPRIPSS